MRVAHVSGVISFDFVNCNFASTSLRLISTIGINVTIDPVRDRSAPVLTGRLAADAMDDERRVRSRIPRMIPLRVTTPRKLLYFIDACILPIKYLHFCRDLSWFTVLLHLHRILHRDGRRRDRDETSPRIEGVIASAMQQRHGAMITNNNV